MTRFVNCVLTSDSIDNQVLIFAITDAKLYVPVVTLSTQDDVKLIEQLKLGFKRTNYWNIYQSKVSIERQNQ